MPITMPRGTSDILPQDSQLWQKLENTLRDVCRSFGYKEIRTPIFEHTELFERGVGSTTDIVEKEMYTFTDRGDRSLTLRPEGTAPVVRSYIEHKMSGLSQPVKLFYIGPMFRYERPQAGRYRQFHQFGAEAFGSSDAMTDAEIISMVCELFKRFGLDDVVVNINSIGCKKCRPAYKEKLKEEYIKAKDELCETCIKRLDRNPLRLLDCKDDKCKKAVPNPPTIYDMLCPQCDEHFSKLKEYLDAAKIKYVLNPRLVRGLDYYTKTTFEFNVGGIGSQDALGGGGRYDDLIEECEGPSTPAVGVACGLERCLLAIKSKESYAMTEDSIDMYVVSFGDLETKKKAFEIACDLRSMGFSAEVDPMDRSLKAQMRNADRLKARFVAIVGEEELKNEKYTVKNLLDGSQSMLSIEDTVKLLKKQ